MCTSFLKKTQDNWLIGMNFDNNGMKYSVSTKQKDWFLVLVDTGKREAPSFGIHKSGIFFNNLCVNSNGKGDYRRSSQVTHTAKLLSGIIDGKIDVGNLREFLEQTEIVNVPDWSTHNMICTGQGNVWVIEPGRGNCFRTLACGEFQIMTNESVLDASGENDILCQRYKRAKELLEDKAKFDVKRAFALLEEVKQSEGEWITEFSLVYDKNTGAVYYAKNQDFREIKEYRFD